MEPARFHVEHCSGSELALPCVPCERLELVGDRFTSRFGLCCSTWNNPTAFPLRGRKVFHRRQLSTISLSSLRYPLKPSKYGTYPPESSYPGLSSTDLSQKCTGEPIARTISVRYPTESAHEKDYCGRESKRWRGKNHDCNQPFSGFCSRRHL